MNKAAIGCLSFVVGAGAGVLGTYFYMKRWADKIIDETIQEFKENYHRHSLPDDNDIGNRVNPVDDDGNPIIKTTSSLTNGPVEIEKTSYHKVTAETYDKSGFLDLDVEDDLDGKTPEDVLLEAEHPQDGGEEDIRLIDIDDYEGDDDIYLKENLIWYTGDDTLVDGEGEIVEDTMKVVGEALDNIDWTGHDVEGDLIYVRNDILQVDYEIECIHANYKDMIE